MGETDPVIVEDLITRVAGQVVHDGVSFRVARGEVFAIIGASGSGKSVLLKAMIRLWRPASGRILVFGREVWEIGGPEELRSIRNRIGVLFQTGALFSGLTVAENVAVPLREQARLREDIIEPVVRLRLLLSGFDPRDSAKLPSALSGGMEKRAALARALALEPELLFLDEPTSGLDPARARELDSLIRTLCDTLGLSIVIVTHDLSTIESIVDRVLILAEGKVLAQGTVEEVARADHEWIHAYFGSRRGPKPRRGRSVSESRGVRKERNGV